jgi:hypothetical protein
MTLERPPRLRFDRAHLLSGFGGVYLANAIVAFLFSASAPVAIILAASQRGGLSEADIASWLFGCFFINGVISLAFCLTYRQPLVFYWTIPGSVLVGQALDHLSFAQIASWKLWGGFNRLAILPNFEVRYGYGSLNHFNRRLDHRIISPLPDGHSLKPSEGFLGFLP